MHVITFLALALVAAAAAAAANNGRVDMEPSVRAYDAATSSFSPTGRALEGGETLQLTFSLKHCPEKKAAFDLLFEAVSTPGNSMYKQYIGIDRITEMLAPSDGAVESVVDFLAQYGITEHSVNRNRDFITAEIPMHAAAKMFQVELAEFKHVRVSEHTMVRSTNGYSLPAAVAEHVAFVEPLLRFPRIREPTVEARKQLHDVAGEDGPFASCGPRCNEATTPEVLQQRYSYAPLTVASPGNSMALAEFSTTQGTDKLDLGNFATNCGVAHVAVDQVQGNTSMTKPGDEALLDVEYIEAVAGPTPLTVINMGEGLFLDWILAVNDDDDAALVHSVSYGADEAHQSSDEYMDQCNTEFQKAGLRGISVLFASGDTGVWGMEGSAAGKHADAIFHPDFPGASPYVTVVGGTNFAERSVIGDESAWEGSGGGFSNYSASPQWQADVVQAYLAIPDLILPAPTKYNPAGRAYPDVAALAGMLNPYCVASNGHLKTIAGTSAACPVWAGIITQLNGQLLDAGQPPLGFLNPWIYQTAAQSIADGAPAFFDVTAGPAHGNNGGVTGTRGFMAAPGWDPVTGVGTPNVTRLETYLGL